MKYLVCNIFGMAAVVTCLALVCDRPARADDEKITEHTIIVEVESDIAGATEAVQTIIDGKLKELPEELKKKIEDQIQARLKSMDTKIVSQVKKGAQPAKAQPRRVEIHRRQIVSAKEGEQKESKKASGTAQAQVWVGAAKAGAGKNGQVRAIVVGPDGKAKTIDVGGKSGPDIWVEKAPTGTEKCPFCSGQATKSIQLRVVADGDKVKEGTKSFTVQIEDGKVTLNGKPFPLAAKQLLGHKGELDIDVDVTDTDGKQMRRIVIVGDKDGQVQRLDLTRDVDVTVKKAPERKAVRVQVQKAQEAQKVQQKKMRVRLNPDAQEARKKAEEARKKAEAVRKKVQEHAEKAHAHDHDHAHAQEHAHAHDAKEKPLPVRRKVSVQEIRKRAEEARKRMEEERKKSPAQAHAEEVRKKIEATRKRIEEQRKKSPAHAHAEEVRKKIEAAQKRAEEEMKKARARSDEMRKRAEEAHKKALESVKHAHAQHAPPHSDQTHDDVVNRLERIEGELKKIRQLLEKIAKQ